jgi:hypothetical protein
MYRCLQLLFIYTQIEPFWLFRYTFCVILIMYKNERDNVYNSIPDMETFCFSVRNKVFQAEKQNVSIIETN